MLLKFLLFLTKFVPFRVLDVKICCITPQFELEIHLFASIIFYCLLLINLSFPHIFNRFIPFFNHLVRFIVDTLLN
jgi:hypothetical protein